MKKKGALSGRIVGILYGIMALMNLFPALFGLLARNQDFDSAFIDAVVYILLTVVLFRGKRDLFSAIIFVVYTVYRIRALSFPSLGVISVTFIVVISCTTLFPKLKPIAKKLYFVPAVFGALEGVRQMLFFEDYLTGCLSFLLMAIFFLTAEWAVAEIEIEPAEKKEIPAKPATANTATNGNPAPTDNNGYYELIKHILLLLFTCGIWYLIWIYRMTGYLNCVEDEEPRNPTNKLLLCIFVPFYSIYWVYKSAQRIDKLAAAKGVSSDLSTLCLILAIFVGIIPPILMQEKINTIVTAENAPVQQQGATVAKVSKANLGTAEELKNYKELLDNGVITQEEFDAKKKQLLGLE